MATTFTGTLKLSATGTLTKDSDLTSLVESVNYTKTFDLANGTSANQANMMWSDTRTLAASSAEDLDLAGGITNSFGDTVTFTKLRGIIIYAASGNTNDVLVGGDATAAIASLTSDTTDVVVVKPGGCLAMIAPASAGYALTATTADILQIANSSSGTSVTYDIVLIGCV